MLVNIWFPKNNLAMNLSPEHKVYTIQLYSKRLFEPVWCDLAWTTLVETYQHHWYTNFDGIEYDRLVPVDMTFKEYINIHRKHIQGMNSFWDLGRLEFITRWKQKWERS